MPWQSTLPEPLLLDAESGTDNLGTSALEESSRVGGDPLGAPVEHVVSPIVKTLHRYAASASTCAGSVNIWRPRRENVRRRSRVAGKLEIGHYKVRGSRTLPTSCRTQAGPCALIASAIFPLKAISTDGAEAYPSIPALGRLRHWERIMRGHLDGPRTA